MFEGIGSGYGVKGQVDHPSKCGRHLFSCRGMVKRRKSSRKMKNNDDLESPSRDPSPRSQRRQRSPSLSSSSMDSLYDNLCKVPKMDSTRPKWSSRREKTLISIWESEPCLYDPKCRNPEKKKQILARIARETGMDTDAVKKRMASLRTVFGRLFLLNEADRKKLSDRELDILETCTFLKPFMRSNKPDNSVKPEDSVKPDSIKPGDSVKTDDSNKNVKQNGSAAGPAHESETANYPVIEQDNPHQFSSSVNIPPFPPNIVSPPPPIAFWGECLNILRNYPKTDFHLHENWARGMAEKLKFFDPLRAEQIKHRFDGIILEYMEELVENR